MVEVEKGPIRRVEQHDGGRLLGLRCNLRTYYSPISTDPTADLASALEAMTFSEIVRGARPGDWSPWGRDLVVESTPTILPDWRRRFAFSPNRIRRSLGGTITGTDVGFVRGQPPLPGHLEDNLFFTLCGLAQVLGGCVSGSYAEWTRRHPDGSEDRRVCRWEHGSLVSPWGLTTHVCALCAALDSADMGAAARVLRATGLGEHARTCESPRSPLLYMIWRSHTGLVRLLHENGHTLEPGGSDRQYALNEAIGTNNVHMVDLLIAAGADIGGGRLRSPPLHQAIEENRLVIARRLLAAGADPRQPDQFGQTPLHRAVHVGNVEGAKLMLMAGADVNATDTRGRTPLLGLTWSGSEDEMIPVLVAAGADLDKRSGAREATIHAAARRGRVAIVRALIAAGARMNVVDDDGLTPLQHAVMDKFDYGRSEVALALIAAGADVHARDAEGNTVLHWAAAHGRTAVVLALLDAGAACDEPDSRGVRPIERAVRGGKPAMIEALRRAGADMRGCREQALTQAVRKPSRRTLGGLRAVLGAEDRLGPAERLALRRRLGPRSPESACAGDAELAAWLRAALGW